MKIVLINAPYVDVYGSLNVGRNYTFPLGLGYIAAALREAGHEVRLLDPEPVRMDDAQIRDYLVKESPDLVGISCATPNFKGAERIGLISKDAVKAPVVLGGVHVSALPEMVLSHFPQFDIAVIGEGERTIVELCSCLSTSVPSSLDEVPGLVFRRNGQLVRTPARPLITDLDKIPFPARDLVDLALYRPQVHVYRGRKSATIITSRGCPARCTYCASGVTMGKGYRPHSAEYVLAEIEHLVDKFGVQDLIIVDDTFTVDRSRVEKICHLILGKGLRVGWFCFARVNNVNEDLFALMKKAGCFSIFFGVESGDNRVLKNIKKGANVEQARLALRISNKLGFKSEAGFMFGNPGDTRETMQRTINLALDLSPTIASFNIMTPFPGTPEYFRLIDSIPDLANPDSWDKFIPKAATPLVALGGLTRQDLQSYVSQAYLKFYLRPGQILRILRNISSLSELLVYVRGAVGLFRRIREWRRASRHRRG